MNVIHSESYSFRRRINLISKNGLYCVCDDWDHVCPLDDLETCYRQTIRNLTNVSDWNESYRGALYGMATFIAGMLGEEVATAIALEYTCGY